MPPLARVSHLQAANDLRTRSYVSLPTSSPCSSPLFLNQKNGEEPGDEVVSHLRRHNGNDRIFVVDIVLGKKANGHNCSTE